MRPLPGRRWEVGGQDERSEFGLRATHTPCIVVESEAEMLLVLKQTVGGVALEVIPYLFSGIEFRSVAGERFNVDTGIVPPQLGHERSLVDSSVVPQEDDWPPQVS